MKITLQNVRLSHANIFQARDFNGDGKFNYSTNCIFAPGSEADKKVQHAAQLVAKEKWGEKGPAMYKQLVSSGKVFFGDGDAKNDDAYHGMRWCGAKNAKRPTIVDRDKTPLVEEDGKPYSGCYANVVIDVWPQDNQWGRRINAKLLGVQFVKDGEAFAGGSSATLDDFETIEDDEDVLAGF